MFGCVCLPLGKHVKMVTSAPFCIAKGASLFLLKPGYHYRTPRTQKIICKILGYFR